ncbi:hypothetical protein B7494_g7193 [Chlorociboria aeruginascens]|nr:hypothetical protein B7494_g7193 [Chlorociboria aeruginascens]
MTHLYNFDSLVSGIGYSTILKLGVFGGDLVNWVSSPPPPPLQGVIREIIQNLDLVSMISMRVVIRELQDNINGIVQYKQIVEHSENSFQIMYVTRQVIINHSFRRKISILTATSTSLSQIGSRYHNDVRDLETAILALENGPEKDDIRDCYGDAPPSERFFLRYRSRINDSKTFRTLKKMPKGAHHHIHFNSGLDVLFLIKIARDVQDMYIKSDIALTNTNDLRNCKIQFDVMTPERANEMNKMTASAREVQDAKNELSVAKDELEKAILGAVQVQSVLQSMRIFSAFQNGNHQTYIGNSWIKYKDFQLHFESKFSENRRLMQQLQMAEIDTNDRFSRMVKTDTLFVEKWLASKLVFTQEDINMGYDKAWDKFNVITAMTKGLFSYEEAFRSYTRFFVIHCVKVLKLTHVEIRPNFMKNNQLKRASNRAETIGNAELVGIIKEETMKAKSQLFADNSLHGPSKTQPGTLQEFETQFKEFQTLTGNKIPFLFHCGEGVLINLNSAVTLNTRRIGHGCSLVESKNLLDLYKQRNIAIECCPTSNEILGACRTINDHMFKKFVASGVPFSVSSDNMTPFRSSPNHEFFQILMGSKNSNLATLKKLALDSLHYSCLGSHEIETLVKEWSAEWEKFCKELISNNRSAEENRRLDSGAYILTPGFGRR